MDKLDFCNACPSIVKFLELSKMAKVLLIACSKVYPYFYTYYSYAKGRWIGRKISELFQAEFRSISDQAMVCHRFQIANVDIECFSLVYLPTENEMSEWVSEGKWRVS